MIRPAVFSALLLSACAGGAGTEPMDGSARERLFVSPSGEPFRATPDGPRPIAVWFARADADRDGSITAAELRADAARWFAVLAGSDAVIDGFEVSAYEQRTLPEMLPDAASRRRAASEEESDILRLPDERPADRPGARGRGGFNLDGATPYGVTGEPHPLMSADFDQSRQIDTAEFARASDERFRLLDKAGDGRLTLSELDAVKLPRRRALRRSREE